MPLFVPILRLSMLFLNIYDSYKVLKLPNTLSRNGGQPGIRALSQRKRDMKGCLAIWIVWSCFTAYERFFEIVTSLFIPFYDEFKAMILLFMILTRARGAEPIYLHVIRPVLKPYTTTLDSAFDSLRMLGDFVLALTVCPVHLTMKRWHETFGRGCDYYLSSGTPAPGPSVLNLATHTGSERLETVHGIKGHTTRVLTERDRASNDTKMSIALPSTDIQSAIWSPQSSSCTEPDDAGAILLSQMPHLPVQPRVLDMSEIIHIDPNSAREVIDAWRQYPPFPSAYPPTPFPRSSQKFSIATTIPALTGVIAGLCSQDGEEAPRQDFQLSPLPLPDQFNLSSGGDVSNDCKVIEASVKTGMHDSVDDMVIINSEDEEEDEFNVTLQTPVVPSCSNLNGGQPQLPDYRFSMVLDAVGRSKTPTPSKTDSSLFNHTSSGVAEQSVLQSLAHGSNLSSGSNWTHSENNAKSESSANVQINLEPHIEPHLPNRAIHRTKQRAPEDDSQSVSTPVILLVNKRRAASPSRRVPGTRSHKTRATRQASPSGKTQRVRAPVRPRGATGACPSTSRRRATKKSADPSQTLVTSSVSPER